MIGAVLAVPVGLGLAAALTLNTASVSDNGGDSPLAQAPGSVLPDDAFAPTPDFFPSPEPGQSSAPPSPRPTEGAGNSRDGVELEVEDDSDSDADTDAGNGTGPDGGSGGGGQGADGGAGSDGGGGSGGGGGDTGSMNTLSAQVFALVNDERADAGCGPVHSDERLVAAAQLHSEDMDANDYMSHTGLNGSGPGDRASAQGYDAWSGENVAKGQRTAQEVMDAWMNSPGHRSNILNCDNKALGVGESGSAWTQLFGRS
ncbi:CAP domain-containing protein [Actinorugispora endophytica]|uniref:CAP domain-containing protein n=1 Tax=Actinorugispora endophytica TaxID=1605990 RepID=UPI0026D68F39